MSGYPPIADLVPHAPPMRLLDELVDWDRGRARCRATIRPDTPLVAEGTLHAVATLEHMAQAVAACLGYEAYLGGEGVRVGMLIGCRRLDLDVETVSVGTTLDVEVERVRGSDSLSRFEGRVRTGETDVASATMTLYHAEQPPDDDR